MTAAEGQEPLEIEYRLDGKGRWRKPAPPTEGPDEEGRAVAVARLSRLMALAIRFEGLVGEGVVANYAELARRGGVSRARLTQIMGLRQLAPDIQEELLFLPVGTGAREVLVERALRGLTQQWDWREQRRLFRSLLAEKSGVSVDKKRKREPGGR